MVNWFLQNLEKFGKFTVTTFVTLLIVSISVLIAYLDSFIFDHNLYPARYLSILIPGVLAPPTIYFLISLVMKLGRVEKEIAAILGGAGDAFFIHDFEGKVLEVNDAACASLGYSRNELLSMNVSDIVDKEDLVKIAEYWHELINETAMTREGQHHRKDGTTFPVESRVSVFKFGDEIRVLALVRDISKRVEQQNALLDSEEKYRNLVETSHEFIWSVDVNGIFTFVNAASKTTHGYDPEEMIGKAFFNFMTPEQAEIDLAVFTKIKEGVDHFDLESVHIRKDGLPVHLNFNAIVIRDAEGNVLGTTGSARDISGRKLAEELTRLHHDQMAHVTRIATLGEMATDIAHELNQPLAAIAAFIDGSLRRLKSGEMPSDSIINALEKASEQAVRAGDVIQHLRNLVCRDERQSESSDMNEVITKVLHLLKPDIGLKQITVQLNLSEEAPIVLGDPILLEQVVLNLIRNSLDVLDDVDIKARALNISSATDRSKVTVTIGDSGPGVDPEYQVRLFEPYYTTKKTGLGMGLPICRSIIDEHEGQISYMSAPGQGAIFEIQLPFLNA